MSDSYRPGSRYDEPPGYDRYRSGPSRPPPDMYHFRGQAERLQQNRPRRDVRFPSLPSNGPRYNDFDFRSDMQGPRGDRGRDFFERPSNGIPTGPRRGGQATRGGFRGGSRQRGASDRVILRSKRATTPERLNGMQEGQASFKALEDLSDSEAEMDLASDAENKSSAEPDGDTDGQPAAKRSRNDHEMMADSVPKWSNPDPYTSLPPPDESQAKKKDVVRLIRKAKVSVEHDQHASNLAADNADFISFNFDDDNMSHRSGSISESDRSSPGPGVRRTKGDQKFSHLDNLHPARTVSPPRPLAERIELPAKPQQASSTANRPSAAGPLPPRLPPQPRGTVNIDTWPPPDTRAAIAKSIGDPSSLLAQPVPQTSGAKQGKKRKRDDITGGVTYAWTPKLNEDATPWCRADHSLTESMGVWLHKEVRDFYDYVKPHEFERTVREDLISRVAKVMSRRYPGGQVYSFGSFAAGIYLPTADMDLVFVSNQYLRGGYPVYASSISWMRKLKTYLEEEGLAHSGAEVVWSAKVPIIKFTDKLSNIRVDVSFENMTGVTANATFQAWKAQFPVMPTIVTLIKQFLLMRGLNEVFTGGVGGFAVTCLVVSMLQHLPAVQSNNMVPEQNLGEMLLNFLDLYGKRFNVNTTAISMAPPGYFPKVIYCTRESRCLPGCTDTQHR